MVMVMCQPQMTTKFFGVVIHVRYIGGIKAAVEIFSLQVWKSIEVPRCWCDLRGVLANEALHWISGNEVGNELLPIFTGFDLANEEFRQMPLTFSINDVNYENQIGLLVLLGECLCIWHYCWPDIQFWVMREYNVPESWTFLYKFNRADLPILKNVTQFKPIFVIESSTLVLEHHGKLIRIECHEKEKPGLQRPIYP